MLIDTHSHINHEKLSDCLDEIIKNTETNIVKKVICPSYDLQSSKSSLLVAKNTNIFCALGIHPENAQEYNQDVENFLLNNLSNPKVVAIGEIGLDYHYGEETKELQKQVLLKQMYIANKANLPIIFHIRDAFEDFFELLEANKNLCKNGVIHCFEGTQKDAKLAIDMGLMISLTGLITFKNRQSLRETVSSIPLEKIMVETDAPYLTPEPFRREVNRPEYVKLVAEKLAEIKNVSLEEVEEITTQNAYRFFDKMRDIDG